MVDICEKCVTDKSECDSCKHAPKYRDYPKASKFMAYKPTCPRGYTDCVCDPAYIKHYHPEWYKELYGDKTLEEAVDECKKIAAEDPDEDYYCYDNEDK